MLTWVRVTREMPDYERITALYERAFPANERRPLDPLLDDPTGCADFAAFYVKDRFVGFACFLSWEDMTHILYIAVEEEARGCGYGAEALHMIREKYAGRRIMADLEAEVKGADNNDQRRKRRHFYLVNGYEQTEVKYDWRNESYEILSHGGNVTTEDFERFWHYFEEENTAFSAF